MVLWSNHKIKWFIKWSLFDLFTKAKPRETYQSVTSFSRHWKDVIPSSSGNGARKGIKKRYIDLKFDMIVTLISMKYQKKIDWKMDEVWYFQKINQIVNFHRVKFQELHPKNLKCKQMTIKLNKIGQGDSTWYKRTTKI